MKNISRTELDAYYVRLYGLTRDELRYMPYNVNPKEARWEDPSAVFNFKKLEVP
jgi:hypothetical protein